MTSTISAAEASTELEEDLEATALTKFARGSGQAALSVVASCSRPSQF
jgi:hypothetical protein